MALNPVSAPLDVNQQPPAIEDGSTIAVQSNSPEEQAELAVLNRLLSRAKKARKKYDKDWEKYDAYYEGNQWFGKKRPSYRATPVANVIRPSIQTTLPIMTDTHPGVDILAQDPGDYQFARILSKAIRALWPRLGVPIKLVEAVEDSLKYGCGFLKVTWDHSAQNGAGEIALRAIDPRNLYVAEGAIDVNDNCGAIFEFYPATIGELKSKFPEKAPYIRATGKKKEDEGGYNTQTYVVSPTDKDDGTENPSIFGTNEDNEVVWVVEGWVDDYTVEDIEGADGEIVKKRKYPRGKIIQAVPDLQLILAVDENPYKDGDKPYIRFVSTVRPREFWGIGEIEPYIETQDLINRALSIMYDYAAMMTNPVWIMDSDSGVDPNAITNQIGLVITKMRGSEVRRESPPSLPPQVAELYQMGRELFDTQCGIHDVTQGRKPTGVTAAEAINTMQEAAQTRIRLKERNMQQALNQLGRMVVSRMLQYYKAPRVVQITGEQGWPEYFEFYVEDVDGGGYRVNQMRYNYNPDTEAFSPGDYNTPEQTPTSKGVFDIEVVAGTALPWMKAQKGELALRLARENHIDTQALLDVLEWPNKEETMRRMQEKAQAEAEAQAQAQAGAMPPPPVQR